MRHISLVMEGRVRMRNKFGLPFLGEIPLELEIREAGDGGTPIAATDSPHGKAYILIAQKIIDSGVL